MARERATSTAKVVAAAAAVFETKGYRNTTIDDICEAAGISRPTVYRYIESKPWVLAQMVDMLTEELGLTLKEVMESDASPGEKLRTLVRLHIDSATRNRTAYATVMNEESELPDDARRAVRAWFRQITNDFTALIEQYLDDQGARPQMESRILGHLMLSMLTSLYRWYDPSGATSPDQLSDQVLVLLNGVLPGIHES